MIFERASSRHAACRIFFVISHGVNDPASWRRRGQKRRGEEAFALH
jgi:hypothetical protein